METGHFSVSSHCLNESPYEKVGKSSDAPNPE